MSRFRAISGLFAGAACFSGAVTAAQVKREVPPRIYVAQLAQCAVKHHRARAVAIVETALFDSKLRRLSQGILGSRCGSVDGPLNTTVEIQDSSFQSAIAAELLRVDPSIRISAVNDIPPLKHLDSSVQIRAKSSTNGLSAAEQKKIEEARQLLNSIFALDYFGECVVRARPEAARALAVSDVASDAETSAFEAIRPALASCVPAGKQLSLSREIVRGTVALNYYRLAKAPRTSQAGAAE